VNGRSVEGEGIELMVMMLQVRVAGVCCGCVVVGCVEGLLRARALSSWLSCCRCVCVNYVAGVWEVGESDGC